MTYGKNLTWFLSQVALADADHFESGSIEIAGVNEQGQEGSTDVEIPDLALAAKNKIEELEKLLIASAEREEGMLVAIGNLQSQLEPTDANKSFGIKGAVENLRVAIQDAEQFGLVRTEDDSVITGAIESGHGIILTNN